MKQGRPIMPQGYLEPQLLPWTWATSRIEAARSYWIASIRANGLPHARPVWGVWLDEQFWFSTGGLIGVNLTANPEVSVNLESADETVILEGTAVPVAEGADQQRFVEVYNPKYAWDMQPGPGIWKVQHRVVFAWMCDPTGSDKGMLFGHTATCWRFDDSD